MNFDEQGNPRQIYNGGKKRTYRDCWSNGGTPQFSGNSQVDAAAFVEAEEKLGDGGNAQGQRCREEEEEAKETKGKNDKDPWPYL